MNNHMSKPEIIVTVQSDKRTFNAWNKQHPDIQGFGRSKKEAIGDLVCKHNLVKITDWAYTSRLFAENRRLSQLAE